MLLDLWFYRKDRLVTTVGESRPPVSLRVSGLINFVLIAAIIAAILGSAMWKPGITFDVYGTTLALQNVLRDGALVLIAILSLVLTPNEHREANGFTWEPIGEVAILFAGIFICIIPVLAMLEAGKDGAFAWLLARSPPRDGSPHELAYFWLTGVLSAFLDNAPTYLVFFELAGGDAGKLMGPLAATLKAISMGAVFMGALTYIGNAPNFMVYAIAVERGVKMPSFFGYMVWSGVVLLPIFALLTFVSAAKPLVVARPPRALRRRLRARRRRQHRDRLDLQQRALARQAGNRDGRAGRPVCVGQVAVAHLAEDRQVLHVGEVIVELDDVLEAGADRRERALEVLERLHRLRAEVGAELAVTIERRAGRRHRRSGPARSPRPHAYSRAASTASRD